MPTIDGRPVYQVRIGKQGPPGPPGPTALAEIVFTGAQLVLDASHAGKQIVMNSSSPQQIVVPAGIWAAVEQATFWRYGPGTVEFVQGSGVPDIRSEGGMRKIAVVNGVAVLSSTATGGTPHYLLSGRLGV